MTPDFWSTGIDWNDRDEARTATGLAPDEPPPGSRAEAEEHGFDPADALEGTY